MERRRALATAAAVTMTALSAFFAVGVGSGAIGIQAAPAPQPVTQPAVAPHPVVHARTAVRGYQVDNPRAGTGRPHGAHAPPVEHDVERATR